MVIPGYIWIHEWEKGHSKRQKNLTKHTNNK